MGGQTVKYLSASVLFSILAKFRVVVHVPRPPTHPLTRPL
jgi:hypothetical protein